MIPKFFFPVVLLIMKYLKSRISWRIPQTNYKKISKTKSHSSFVGNIWGAHFADM